MIGPGYVITPPGWERPRHDLMASAVFPAAEPNDRWMLGFEFEPSAAIPVIAYPGSWCYEGPDLVSSPPSDGLKPDKPMDAPPELVQYTPFTLVTSYSCPWGRDEAERIAKVREQLTAGESKALEAELWSGALSASQGYSNMHLADGDGTVLNPGYDPDTDTPADAVAVDLVSGLATLEQHLADCVNGTLGMIHVTPYVASVATAGGLWEADRNLLRTKSRGDIVVVGNGYDGTGPDGDDPAAPKVWLHATGLVNVRLGPVEILPEEGQIIHAGPRGSNRTVTHIAERVAAVYWSGLCHGSVLVDMTAGWLTGGYTE